MKLELTNKGKIPAAYSWSLCREIRAALVVAQQGMDEGRDLHGINEDFRQAVEKVMGMEWQAGEKFYCQKHRYNPADNSGFNFCPTCEVES